MATNNCRKNSSNRYKRLNNFSNYYGRNGEPSPVYWRGNLNTCEHSHELILSKITELEEKLKAGLELDTSDLEEVIENKIEEVIDRNNSQIADTLEAIASKVDDNTEKLEEIEEKIEDIDSKVSDIYSEMFGCHCNSHHENSHCCGNNIGCIY